MYSENRLKITVDAFIKGIVNEINYLLERLQMNMMIKPLKNGMIL